jgi:hypothetical protein
MSHVLTDDEYNDLVRRAGQAQQPRPSTMVLSTHTLAVMEVPAQLYGFVKGRLEEAGYSHAIDDEGLDMTGVMLAPLPEDGPVPVAFLDKEDAELCRQWFDNVQDLNPDYLKGPDYHLAEGLYMAVGMRVPNSIKGKTGPAAESVATAPSESDQEQAERHQLAAERAEREARLKRLDLFTGRAMQTIYMRLGGTGVAMDADTLDFAAKHAYDMADAMEKERTRRYG